MARTRVVYLLHLSGPVNPARPARHYLGSCADLDSRLAEHANGQGARMLAAAVARGLTWEVARTWKGGRTDERRLKSRKNAPRELCPICRAERATTTTRKGRA